MAHLPPPKTPVILGLAGGIGAGKSHVAAAFARRGWLVFDFDRMTREALESSSVREMLAQWWGPRVLDSQGRINRSAVGQIVFDDPAQRRRLEALIHPMVWRTRAQAIEAAQAVAAPGVIFDAPLLFEAGLDAECDGVVFVHADPATRAGRVSGRGWSGEELARRESAQWPLDEKRRRSRYFVDNSGASLPIDEQVADIVAMLSVSDPGAAPRA